MMASPTLTSSMTLTGFAITVLALVTSSLAQQRTIPYRVTENQAGATIGILSESDYISQTFDDVSVLKYHFLTYPLDDPDLLNLDRESGELTTARALDREEYCASQQFCYLQATVSILQGLEPVASVALQILLDDENDNAPVFADTDIEIAISESAAVDSTRSLLLAQDDDSPENGIDTSAYELRSTNQNPFRVDYVSDELLLVLTDELDRETMDVYNFALVAYDLGSPRLSSSVNVTVRVTDFNDHAPVFQQTLYDVTEPENFAVGRQLVRVSATDDDIGANGEVTYALADFTQLAYGDVFRLDASSGWLTLAEELDYETNTFYMLEVVAHDGGPQPLVSTATVQLQVLDVNDNRPRVQVNTLTDGDVAEVEERKPVGEVVAHVSVLDDDSGANGDVLCSLADQSNFRLQAIPDSTQYKLITDVLLDRESQAAYSLVITCKDDGEPQLSQQERIDINVLDVNDNAPRFTQDSYSVDVVENGGIGAVIMQLSATDADVGENARVTYTIAQSTAPNYLAIDASSGIIRSATVLDYEDDSMPNHQILLRVHAVDNGFPANTATASVIVNVSDDNDQSPVFTQARYAFSVLEHVSPEARVGVVAASDADSDLFNDFTLSLEQTYDATSFRLKQNGEITTAIELDRETQNAYSFSVYAIDTRDQTRRAHARVDVTVVDVNDHKPVINYPTGSNRTKMISTQVPIGYGVIQILANDNDVNENAEVIYQLQFNESSTDTPQTQRIHSNTANAERFQINLNTGLITTTALLTSIEHEEVPVVALAIDRNKPSFSSSVELTLIIDATIPFSAHSEQSSDDGGGGGSSSAKNSNLSIIVALSVVTAVIVTALVVAIVLLKMRRPRKPRSSYIHTTIEAKAAASMQADRLSVKEDLGSDETINSTQSQDSGKGASETDPSEQKTDSELMQAQRPVYMRSKSADRLSLSIPAPARSDISTYMRPVSSRHRAVSESSASRHGVMPGSPLDVPDSIPLWHGSYDRVPSMTDHAQLARVRTQHMSHPTTPTGLSTSHNQFGYPRDLRHAQQYKPPQPQQAHSVPTTPSALPGHEHFRFPPAPLSLMPSPQRSSDTEGVYESYGSDRFNQSHGSSFAPPQYESLQGHSQGQAFQPLNNQHLHRQFSHPGTQHHGQYNLSSGHVLPPHGQVPAFMPMTSALQAEFADLSASMSQHSQQYFDQHHHHQQQQQQQHRLQDYSPNHYTQIHYPAESNHPTDLVV